MANSFTQLHYHYVFVTDHRTCCFTPEIKDKVIKYMIGIANNSKCIIHEIEGCANHIHLLATTHPNVNVSTFARLLKCNTSKYINDEHLLPFKFQWQNGYSAFSVSHSNMEVVRNYISNQEEHHKTHTLHDEYISLLEKHGISYQKEYLPSM